MAKIKSMDRFVCNEPAVEISLATSRILKQRMKTADEGRLVSAEKARQRIQKWLSKSSTMKNWQAISLPIGWPTACPNFVDRSK